MQYGYDGFGRIIKAINAAGSSTQIIYDDAYVNSWSQKGNKRTIIDPIGNITEEIFVTIQIPRRSLNSHNLNYYIP